MTDMNKNCCGCLEEKPVSDFYRRGERGVCSICKACSYKKYKAWVLKNPDKAKAISAKTRLKNAASIKEGKKVYYQNNKEAANTKAKEWAKKNRPKRNIIKNNWREKNKERYLSGKRKHDSGYRERLSNGYVKAYMKSKGYDGLSNEVIELKRIQLAGKRKIKQLIKNGKKK